MSFNGSGTFVLNIGGYPYVTGTVISSVNVNLLLQDLANGLSLTVTRDGQMSLTGPLHLGSNYIDGVTNLTATGTIATSGAITVAGTNVTAFPSGTRLSFQQSAAPTGWTQDTVPTTDALMRFTTGTVGSGGSQAFTTWNALTTTGGHSLSTAELAAHNHTTNESPHTHTPTYNYLSGQNTGVPSIAVPGGATQLYASQAINSATTGITINSNCSGTAHTHPLTNGIRYLDFIIAVKN